VVDEQRLPRVAAEGKQLVTVCYCQREDEEDARQLGIAMKADQDESEYLNF
jgi:hypothetical protein